MVDLDFERGTAVAGLDFERKRLPLRESAQPLDGNPATEAGESRVGPAIPDGVGGGVGSLGGLRERKSDRKVDVLTS